MLWCTVRKTSIYRITQDSRFFLPWCCFYNNVLSCHDIILQRKPISLLKNMWDFKYLGMTVMSVVWDWSVLGCYPSSVGKSPVTSRYSVTSQTKGSPITLLWQPKILHIIIDNFNHNGIYEVKNRLNSVNAYSHHFRTFVLQSFTYNH